MSQPAGVNNKSSATRLQGTNDSSIVSKRSMAQAGYFNDQILPYFVHKPQRRSSAINRGYFIRAHVIDDYLRAFINGSGCASGCQVVSLGCGYDTSFFRLAQNGQLGAARFFEVDFPGVVNTKSSIVTTTPELSVHLGQALSIDDSLILHHERYSLMAVDLHNHGALNQAMKKVAFQADVPTLFLSECVLTYNDPLFSTEVIRWCSEACNASSCFILYEQIHPNDAFGLRMQKHFNTISSPLRGITVFPTLAAQITRVQNSGWASATVVALDMNSHYYTRLSAEERLRVAKLEIFDEYEEWHLKGAHYFVLCAVKESTSANSWLTRAFDTTVWPSFEHMDAPSAPTVAAGVAAKILPGGASIQYIGRISEETELCTGPALRMISVDKAESLALGRSSHTAAQVLLHGTERGAVIFGGFGGVRHGRLNDVQFLSADTYAWRHLTPSGTSPSERLYHSSVLSSCHRYFMILGGRTGPTWPLADVHVFDAKLVQWKAERPLDLPSARFRASAALIGNNVFVHGGLALQSDGGLRCDDCMYTLHWRVNEDESWSSAAWTLVSLQSRDPALLRRHSHSLTRAGHDLLIYGGLDKDELIFSSLLKISLSQQNSVGVVEDLTSTFLPALPACYSHTATMTSDGSKMLIVGGIVGAAVVRDSDVYVIDLVHRIWQRCNIFENMLSAQMLLAHAVCPFGAGQLLVCGGGLTCFSFGTHQDPMSRVIDARSVLGEEGEWPNCESKNEVN